MIKNIILPLIDGNPWQPRTSVDPAGIEELALSIARDRLMQVPVGRINPNTTDEQVYQLALGHRRLMAFRILSEISHHESPNGYRPDLVEAVDKAITAGRSFDEIPLDIQDLSDRQMFELALSENLQRKDLQPVEVAAAMKRYMEEFQATSEVCGVFFGVAGATVRGNVRLLDLPENVKNALAEGQITVGAARHLLTMQKLLPSKMDEAVKKIVNGEDAESVINRLFTYNQTNILEMRWTNNKNLAGEELWELSMKKFPVEYLPALPIGLTYTHKEHLENPPACSACPFFAIVGGDRFCGLQQCYRRKEEAWSKYKIEKLGKKLGIALYQESDGPYLVLENHYPSHEKHFKSRHADLRLLSKEAVKGYYYQHFDDTPNDTAFVVTVGKSFEKLAVRGAKTGGKKSEKEKAEMRAMRSYRMHRRELVWEYTAAASSLFYGIPMETLKKICNWHFVGIDDRIPKEHELEPKATADEKLEFQCRDLVWRLVVGETSHFRRESLVKLLDKFQEITQMKAPRALVKKAQEWDAEIAGLAGVAVETVEEKA
jgi:ParB-like chromosome segregation protein Spo0J